MPPVRTTSTIKPTTTTRTHAENQERAYIAASRRSDRSLEARVESARRASEIHKQRTGRSLRVREEDVLNEEMYEEEDDDMHWQYRRMGLIGNFPVNPDLQRRFEAFTTFNMERANLLARAVANANQNSPQSPQFPSQQQFMGPPPMQQGYQNPSPQPAPPNRTPSSYRQSPYPVQGGHQQQQSKRPNVHQRAASIATPQDVSSMNQQQYSHFQTNMDNRRGSLPAQSLTPTGPDTQPESMNHLSPVDSKHTPSSRTPTSQHSQPSPQLPQQQRPNSFAGPFYADSNASQEMDNPLGPLTTSLPMETQQLLAGGMFQPYGDQQSMWASDWQQPFYSYNPNSKTKGGKMNERHMTSEGLNQTLMPTALDTNMGKGHFFDSPLSADPDTLNSAVSNHGYGLGFDNGSIFNLDPFAGCGSSGQRTPADEFMSQFVDGNMFADQPPVS